MPHPEVVAPASTRVAYGLQSKLKSVLAGVSPTPTLSLATWTIFDALAASGLACPGCGRLLLLLLQLVWLVKPQVLRTAAGSSAEQDRGWLP